MGFWSNLGKIALTAAPYVAAPFTGGASLALAPVTSGAVKKWNESDAQKAAAKGLAPSNMDRAIEMGGDYAGMAASMGAFGGGSGKGKGGSVFGRGGSMPGGMDIPLYAGGTIHVGGQPPGGYGGPGGQDNRGGYGGGGYSGGSNGGYGNQGGNQRGNPRSGYGGGGRRGNNTELDSGWQDALNKIINPNTVNRLGRFVNEGFEDEGGYGGGGRGGFGGGGRSMQRDPRLDSFHRQMSRQLGPVMGASNQNDPNLADSIGAGRMDAIRNQPFRGGYDVISYGAIPEEGGYAPEVRTPMPPIFSGGGRRRQVAPNY